MTRRQQIHALVDPRSHAHVAGRVRTLGGMLALIGISAISIDTLPHPVHVVTAIAAACVGIVAAVFMLEYLVRLWVAPEVARFRNLGPRGARLRWAVSGEGVIDLLAVLPVLATASGGARLGAVPASVYVLLWVIKLASDAQGFELIVRVVRNHRSALSAVAVLFLIVLFSAATLIHLLEGQSQPKSFGSIPASLWWAMVTLTTTGYGDVIPHTPLGRMLGGLVMICGIAVLALLAGILAMGFADEVRRREFARIWELVARVPFFADVGAIAISDIVARLRSRNYPPGTHVIRKGEPGDSMYFIVAGEVEVRIGGPVRTLSDGGFFGEMALIDRKPRSADVVTVTPCTLLVLEVVDFYQLAGQQPSLVRAIEAEADHRRESDRLRA